MTVQTESAADFFGFIENCTGKITTMSLFVFFQTHWLCDPENEHTPKHREQKNNGGVPKFTQALCWISYLFFSFFELHRKAIIFNFVQHFHF
jgi:hypothetical protein